MAMTLAIDQRAQDVFRMTLPAAWLKREEHPDIHIDYFVETTSGSKPTGLKFGVQLKGTKRPSRSKKFIKYSLKTKHLKYYLDRVQQPVFLVVIDIKKEEGFWLFIQQWAQEALPDEKWRDQKTVTISIPIENALDDSRMFLEKIKEADTYMKDLWPSSIIAAVDHERQSLERLDPRISVDVAFHGGSSRYTLSAKESVPFTIQFNDSSALQEKISNLLETGEKATIEMEEMVGISGSPLLENVFKKRERGKIILQPRTVANLSVTLSTVDLNGNEKTTLQGITGEMSVGNQGFNFEGGLSKSPLKIGLFIHQISSNEKLKMKVGFDYTAWEGQSILMLSFFEKLKIFLCSVQENQCIKIICESEGNLIISGKAHLTDFFEFFHQIIEYLEILEKLRLVAKAVGINPKYPVKGEFSKQEVNEIFLLYPLVQGREFRQKVTGQKGVITLEGDAQDYNNYDQKVKANDFGELAWEVGGQTFNLLDETFEFASLRYTLTKVRIASKYKAQSPDRNESSQSCHVIEWESGPETELIISKV